MPCTRPSAPNSFVVEILTGSEQDLLPVALQHPVCLVHPGARRRWMHAPDRIEITTAKLQVLPGRPYYHADDGIRGGWLGNMRVFVNPVSVAYTWESIYTTRPSVRPTGGAEA